MTHTLVHMNILSLYVQNVMARVYQYDELAHINVMDEVI